MEFYASRLDTTRIMELSSSHFRFYECDFIRIWHHQYHYYHSPYLARDSKHRMRAMLAGRHLASACRGGAALTCWAAAVWKCSALCTTGCEDKWVLSHTGLSMPAP